jgi:hypothetical protein
MFAHRLFDVKITRSLDGPLRWPDPGEAADESGLGMNRSYGDLRGMSWKDAKGIFEHETSLIDRMEAADDPEEEQERITEEMYEHDVGLFGLDMGVASAAIALSAAGCITCTCCNAGAFGDGHAENYPVVAFFAKPRHVELLLKCAEEAGVGLENHEGTAIVFANDIRRMRLFATALIQQSGKFRELGRGTRKSAVKVLEQQAATSSSQLKFPFDGD